MFINSFSKLGITIDIRKLLINDIDINSFVGTKIYPITAPQNTIGDVIVLESKRNHGVYGQQVLFQNICDVYIYSVSENYDNSLNIAKKIYEVIEGVHLNHENYEYRCTLIDSSEGLIDKKYYQELKFEIK